MSDELKEAYDEIADDYLTKKQDVWRDFKSFFDLLNFPRIETVIDLGAGNGRNLVSINASFHIAFDLSLELLRGYVGPENGQRVAGALPHSPFRNNSADLCLMIAVLHHFRTVKERVSALSEIPRLCVSGTAIISVWRKWRSGYRDKIIQAVKENRSIDSLVDHERPWYTSSREIVTTRFYHYYTFKELYHQLQIVGLSIDIRRYMGGNNDDANIFVKTSKDGNL